MFNLERGPVISWPCGNLGMNGIYHPRMKGDVEKLEELIVYGVYVTSKSI
jgi:hypothetical protein